jgi:hypothetical protein
MASHFLLSAAAKTLSLSAVARMSDDEARATFQRLRWSDNGGEPYCPQCGVAKVYALQSRPVWKGRPVETNEAKAGGLCEFGCARAVGGFKLI